MLSFDFCPSLSRTFEYFKARTHATNELPITKDTSTVNGLNDGGHKEENKPKESDMNKQLLDSDLQGHIPQGQNSEKRPGFFKSLPPFPSVDPVTKTVPTIEFLTASKGIIHFANLAGIAFKPVSANLSANVVKITNKYQEFPEKYSSLNGILTAEKATIKDGNLRVGSTAICWLNRCLKFLSLFLVLFVQDWESRRNVEEVGNVPGSDLKSKQGSSKSENLSPYLGKAYELTLKKHHSWLFRRVFSLCLLGFPMRSALIKMLKEPAYQVGDKVLPNQDGGNALLNQVEEDASGGYQFLDADLDESALFGQISTYLINLKAVNDTIDQLFIDLDIKI